MEQTTVTKQSWTVLWECPLYNTRWVSVDKRISRLLKHSMDYSLRFEEPKMYYWIFNKWLLIKESLQTVQQGRRLPPSEGMLCNQYFVLTRIKSTWILLNLLVWIFEKVGWPHPSINLYDFGFYVENALLYAIATCFLISNLLTVTSTKHTFQLFIISFFFSFFFSG